MKELTYELRSEVFETLLFGIARSRLAIALPLGFCDIHTENT